MKGRKTTEKFFEKNEKKGLTNRETSVIICKLSDERRDREAATNLYLVN